MDSDLATLRASLRLCELAGFTTSAKELRRKISILRGHNPDAKRRRVRWSRPSRLRGHFFVRLTCGHLTDARAPNCGLFAMRGLNHPRAHSLRGAVGARYLCRATDVSGGAAGQHE